MNRHQDRILLNGWLSEACFAAKHFCDKRCTICLINIYDRDLAEHGADEQYMSSILNAIKVTR